MVCSKSMMSIGVVCNHARSCQIQPYYCERIGFRPETPHVTTISSPVSLVRTFPPFTLTETLLCVHGPAADQECTFPFVRGPAHINSNTIPFACDPAGVKTTDIDRYGPHCTWSPRALQYHHSAIELGKWITRYCWIKQQSFCSRVPGSGTDGRGVTHCMRRCSKLRVAIDINDDTWIIRSPPGWKVTACKESCIPPEHTLISTHRRCCFNVLSCSTNYPTTSNQVNNIVDKRIQADGFESITIHAALVVIP